MDIIASINLRQIDAYNFSNSSNVMCGIIATVKIESIYIKNRTRIY